MEHANSVHECLVLIHTANEMDVELQETQELDHRKRGWLRNLFTAKQLYECLQPLFFFLYFHGLIPFYIRSDASGKKELKHSAWGYVNVALHLVVYGTCYTLTLMNNFETVAGYFFCSRISHFGDFMQILSGFLGVTVIYLTAIIPKHYVERSLTVTYRMDRMLHSMGIKIMYSKILRYSYIYILSMMTVNLCYTFGSFQLLRKINEAPSLSLHITFILQHTVVLFAVAMFSCFSRMIEMRFNMMHQVSGG